MFKRIKTSFKSLKEKKKTKRHFKNKYDNGYETSSYMDYAETQSSEVLYRSNLQPVSLRQTQSTGDLLKSTSQTTLVPAQSEISLQLRRPKYPWRKQQNKLIDKKAEKQRVEEQKQLEKQRIEWLKKLEKQRLADEKRRETLLVEDSGKQEKIEKEREKIKEKEKDTNKGIELRRIERPNEPLAIQSVSDNNYASFNEAGGNLFNMPMGYIFTQLFFLFAVIVVFISFLRFVYVVFKTIYNLKLIW